MTGEFADADDEADIGIIVVTYNSATDLPDLIEDLRAEAAAHTIRLVVVDNDSADASLEAAQQHPDVIAIAGGGNLGYAGGINAALPHLGGCRAILILNPDLRVRAGAIATMAGALWSSPRIGAVVPRIEDPSGSLYPSLRHEPTIRGALGDAVFGARLWRRRPTALSEFDYRDESYTRSHEIDWATGAAVMVSADVADEIGPWREDFFLYSEETDYFRRIRESGRVIRFVPDAVVVHELGGSGSSVELSMLLTVNKIRYAEMWHGPVYSAAFRGAIALAEAARSYDPAHRRTLGMVLDRGRWDSLPSATPPSTQQLPDGPRHRGVVIVPAYNEAAVIEHTLHPLSAAASAGFFDVIVVCNGCTDDTAERARSVPGIRVIEVGVGSKPLALNTGDAAATGWPRLYLDADIDITANTVVAVLDRLAEGDILAARPAFRYGTEGARRTVRSYYRARTRMGAHQNALWWAGVYGLNEAGHGRFGEFPDVTGDDKFVDAQFDDTEKTVVEAEPSVWHTPTDTEGLLTVLSRHHRGNRELAQTGQESMAPTMRTTALAILRSARGPRSAADACVYLVITLLARRRAAASSRGWERDDSSRSAAR